MHVVPRQVPIIQSQIRCMAGAGNVVLRSCALRAHWVMTTMALFDTVAVGTRAFAKRPYDGTAHLRRRV
jgi:hypothetical protein